MLSSSFFLVNKFNHLIEDLVTPDIRELKVMRPYTWFCAI